MISTPSTPSSSTERSRACLTLLALGLFAALVLPKSTTVGMFQDGVVFASVARNLAEGVGSFWSPSFTDTAYQIEAMHPPLGVWILSWFYRLFGDSPQVEVFYGIGLGLLNLGLLALLWRTATRGGGARSGAWLPLLLYVTMPMTLRAYTSNLLENPMTSFVLAAAIASHLAVGVKAASSVWLGSAIAGALVFLAVQTKGPPGLYILVYPAMLTLLAPNRELRRGLIVSAVAAVTVLALSAAVILPDPDAREFTRLHYTGLVRDAVVGGEIPAKGRWKVLQTLVVQLLVPVLLVLLAAWRVGARPRPDALRRDLVFLLTGLAGTLPFLITTHQFSRYAYPAMPMMVLALVFFADQVGARIELGLAGRAQRLVVATAVLLAGAGVLGAALNSGEVHKHEAFHLDFTAQPLSLEGRPLLSVCPETLAIDWVLVGDIQRHLRASLTPEPGAEYWLTEVGSGCAAPSGCRAIHPPQPQSYRLYDCR